jgi:hypothetical protein
MAFFILGKDHVYFTFMLLTVHHDPVLDVRERGILNALDTLVQESTSQSGRDYDNLGKFENPAMVVDKIVHDASVIKGVYFHDSSGRLLDGRGRVLLAPLGNISRNSNAGVLGHHDAEDALVVAGIVHRRVLTSVVDDVELQGILQVCIHECTGFGTILVYLERGIELDFISSNRPRAHCVENRLLGPHFIAIIVGGPVTQTADQDGVTAGNCVCVWLNRTFEHHGRIAVYNDVVFRKLAQDRLNKEWLPYPKPTASGVFKVLGMGVHEPLDILGPEYTELVETSRCQSGMSQCSCASRILFGGKCQPDGARHYYIYEFYNLSYYKTKFDDMFLRRKHFIEERLPYETFNIHVKVFRK